MRRGALWTRVRLEQCRVTKAPPLRHIIIGVDPGSDVGIVVAGVGEDAGYVLAVEANHGGDMALSTIQTQDRTVAGTKLWASQGKYARAEPVSALYEQGNVHHVGMFAVLEDELCTWVPGEDMPSPNRLDALVWALTTLLLEPEARIKRAGAWSRPRRPRGQGKSRYAWTAGGGRARAAVGMVARQALWR